MSKPILHVVSNTLPTSAFRHLLEFFCVIRLVFYSQGDGKKPFYKPQSQETGWFLNWWQRVERESARSSKLLPQILMTGGWSSEIPRVAGSRNSSSSHRDSLTGSKIISGKKTSNPISVFSRYVMRGLQGPWLPKGVVWRTIHSGHMI
jgi:hypothetical protein